MIDVSSRYKNAIDQRRMKNTANVKGEYCIIMCEKADVAKY